MLHCAGRNNPVENAAIAASLFGQCEQGLLEITTLEAVIAEVAFILTSKRHYALSRAETFSRLLPLLQLPGCKLISKDKVILALERWRDSDRLSFVDALVVEQSLGESAPLATFDRQVVKVPEVTVWSAE